MLAAHGQQSRLVHQVFKIRTGEAGRAFCDGFKVNVIGKGLASGVYPQDRLAALYVGKPDIDLTVEASGTQQRIVEDVRAVGRRHYDNALVVAEAVHLDKKLVQGLLALIVSAAEAGAALTADSVDLINEYDRWGDLFGLIEQVADAARADTDIKLDKVRAGYG